jgi:hypothetical protein
MEQKLPDLALTETLTNLGPTDLRRLWNNNQKFRHLIQQDQDLLKQVEKCMIHLIEIGECPDGCPSTEDLEAKHPGISEYFCRGDLIENKSESGYRSQGVYCVDQVDGQWKIVYQYDEFDDYGTPAIEFHGISQFPLNHWALDNLNCNNTYTNQHRTHLFMGQSENTNPDCEFYWHIEPVMVAFYPEEVGMTMELEAVEPLDQNLKHVYTIFTFQDEKYIFIASDEVLKIEEPPLAVCAPWNNKIEQYEEPLKSLLLQHEIKPKNVILDSSITF